MIMIITFVLLHMYPTSSLESNKKIDNKFNSVCPELSKKTESMVKLLAYSSINREDDKYILKQLQSRPICTLHLTLNVRIHM